MTTFSLLWKKGHCSQKLALLSGDYFAAVSYYIDLYMGPKMFQETVVPSGFTGTTGCGTGMKRETMRVYVEEHR